MKTTTKWRTGLQILLATSLCGSIFQVGSCLSSLGRNFNPCGTILTCDPAEFDLMTMDPLQPNYDYNPTCVVPGLFNCTTPITGFPGAGTDDDTFELPTTTTTTTTTGGNRGSFGSGLGGFGF